MSVAEAPEPRTRRRWAAVASTVGNKIVIALTGLALVGFLVAHLAGNLQVFEGPEALNGYALFLKNQGALLWAARAGLLTVFVLHVALALRLQLRDRAARPVAYARRNYRRASLASRTMLVTGLVVLAFVVFHLAHFTFGLVHHDDYLRLEDYRPSAAVDPARRHDVYGMVIHSFQDPVITVTYVAAMLFLGFHLAHGIASTLQTLGLNGPRWHRLVHGVGVAAAAALALGNISMPLAILLGFVK